MIEGLNRLISKTRNEGFLLGIKFWDDIIITHLICVDDVILFDLDKIKTLEEYVFSIGPFLQCYKYGS